MSDDPKYIIMSDEDKIDFATDDLEEAIAAFAATTVVYSKLKDPSLGPHDPVYVRGIDNDDGVGLISYTGSNHKDPDPVVIGLGLTEDDWVKYGPEGVLSRRKRVLEGTNDIVMANNSDHKFAYTVIGDAGQDVMRTDDREEAFRNFVKVVGKTCKKYGYGPGNPAALVFMPVPDSDIDRYPRRDRMVNRNIIIATIHGTSILLGVLEGGDFEEWKAVAGQYLEETAGPGGARLITTEEANKLVSPPQNLKSPEEAIAELGNRYLVMKDDMSIVLRTDEPVEALLAFYEAISGAMKGGDEYDVRQGPNWADSTLPALAGFVEKRKTAILIGMSKREHDMIVEPQAIFSGKNGSSPWGATIH